MARAPIQIGERHRLLTVLSHEGRHPNGRDNLFKVQCDCGAILFMRGMEIRHRVGCVPCAYKSGANLRMKHGASQSRGGLYSTWRGIKNRCRNKKSDSYKWYGAKGVKICQEWLDFSTFRDWCLENGWRPGLTIERNDPTGNYDPGNCSFLTQSANSKRMRAKYRLTPIEPFGYIPIEMLWGNP